MHETCLCKSRLTELPATKIETWTKLLILPPVIKLHLGMNKLHLWFTKLCLAGNPSIDLDEYEDNLMVAQGEEGSW